MIRAALNDPQAIDRISAAESLGKLDAASRDDRAVVFQWLKTADNASAPYPRWLLVLSSTARERSDDEAALAAFVRSDDPVARIRAAFALGRLKHPCPGIDRQNPRTTKSRASRFHRASLFDYRVAPARNKPVCDC